MEQSGSRNRRDAITSRFRLRDYDYSLPGLYFISICTQDRVRRFGRVADGVMMLNNAGHMVSDQWIKLHSSMPDVSIEHFVVMPNHVHAIVAIGLETPDAVQHPSLPDVIHWFKSTSTGLYIKGVKAHNWPRFERRLWQKGYHDRIIRNDREFDRFWDYIEANPAQWERDTFFG